VERPPESDQNELFGSNFRNDIGKILGLAEDPDFPVFLDGIAASGKLKRSVLEKTPSAFSISPPDMSATQRVTWLERNILHPVAKIEAALAEENHPHFIHWETELLERQPPCPARDIEGLLSSLNELRGQAEDIITKLKLDLDMKVQTTDEIRFSIVYDAIQDLHEAYPNFRLSRGNWYTELKQTVGVLPEFVRRVFLETTGHHEQLDGPIQLALKDIRKSQSKSG